MMKRICLLISVLWGCSSCEVRQDRRAEESGQMEEPLSAENAKPEKDYTPATGKSTKKLSEKEANKPVSSASDTAAVSAEKEQPGEKSKPDVPAPMKEKGAEENKPAGEEKKESPVAVAPGIRFSFQDVPKDLEAGVYLSRPADAAFLVKPIIGLFSPTLPFPEDGVVKLYSASSTPDSEPILTAKIPEGLGKQVLAIIVPLKDGRNQLVFLDKNSIKGEKFFVKNVSGEHLGIQMGSQEIVELADGAEHFFVPAVKNGQGVYSGKLKAKGKKGDWYSSKMFAFRFRDTIFEIILVIHKAEFGKPDIQKFLFAEEPAQTSR